MALPTNVSYGTIVGRFLRAVADVPEDVDREPQGLPISNLTITFSPDLPDRTVTNTTSTPPVTILLEKIVVNTDSSGVLVGPDGAEGIVLVASTDPDLKPSNWTWNVSIEGPTYQRKSFSFPLNPDTTVDLSTVVPVAANPGLELVQWNEAVNKTAVNVGLTQAHAESASDARVEATNASVAAAISADDAQDSVVAAAVSASLASGYATTASGHATNAANAASASAASADEAAAIVAGILQVTDNGDGTYTITGPVTDNGDGTFTITA